MHTTKIGHYLIERIVESERPYAPAMDFFPDLTAEMLAVCKKEFDPNQITTDGRLQMSFTAFVIKTGRLNIMVDTCCGEDKERPLRPAFHRAKTNFLQALTAAKLKPEEIDFVMCTHLHWDHVGWNTRLINGAWAPTFPNAKYIMSKVEFDHWDRIYRSGEKNTHTQAFEDSVDPIVRANQAVLVKEDYELEKGISVQACPGHTPGNFVINVSSNNQMGVLTGDVMHHQIQLRFPEMSTIADEDQDLSRISRTAFIQQHADTGHLIFPSHFPSPTVGTIVTNATGGFKFKGHAE